MSHRDEIISGKAAWERRKNRDSFVCRCRQENDERDESFRHCGCLDCRRRRHNEAYMYK